MAKTLTLKIKETIFSSSQTDNENVAAAASKLVEDLVRNYNDSFNATILIVDKVEGIIERTDGDQFLVHLVLNELKQDTRVKMAVLMSFTEMMQLHLSF